MATFQATDNEDSFTDVVGTDDSVSYADAKAAVTVNLTLAGPQATGGSGNDTFVSIESLV